MAEAREVTVLGVFRGTPTSLLTPGQRREYKRIDHSKSEFYHELGRRVKKNTKNKNDE